MKYDELNLQKIREVPIFDVCSKLGITLHGTGELTKRAECWYHDDQHPSMHVNKVRNIFKCFVCGKGGDVIKLVMDNENKSFVEACDWLVDEFDIVLIEDKPSTMGNCSKSNSKLDKNETKFVKFSSEAGSKTLVPLDGALVAKSLSVDSVFAKAVISQGYLSQGQLVAAANRYRLGASKEGGVIFWEIDDQQRVHTGKIMYYQPDCHRDKEHKPTWVHHLMKDRLPANYELQHCLFGLHLLMEQPSAGNYSKSDSKLNNSCVPLVASEHSSSAEKFSSVAGKIVAIVESEKTAVIMSEVARDVVWMSCGGLQMFKAELLEPLVNHKVVIFPDTDETGNAYKAWLKVLQQAQRQYAFRFPLRISRLLEDHATPEQKARKIDIVDYLFDKV